MERANEAIGNKYGEDKSTEQGRIAGEGLRRQQGDAPAVGDGAVPQHEVVKDTAPVTTDSSLSWASGEHIASSQPGEPRMSPAAISAAAVSGPGGVARFSASPPTIFPAAGGARLRSVPDCSEGNWNMSDILGERKR